jgi:hypothetical protein
MPIGAATQGSAGAASWQALTRDKSLQFNFPDVQQPDPKPPSWLRHLVEFLRHYSNEIGWAGWVLLAALVALALWFLVRRLRNRPPPRAVWPPRETMSWQPSARQARLALRDADLLAMQGRFDEAVHTLLLVSIQEISDRRHELVTPALTSREIAALPALSALAQRIFFGIAQVVEHSRFGGHAIGEAEFRRCRAAFEQFTAADTWRTAA